MLLKMWSIESRINISSEFIRNAEYKAAHEICGIRTDVFLIRTPDDLYAY